MQLNSLCRSSEEHTQTDRQTGTHTDRPTEPLEKVLATYIHTHSYTYLLITAEEEEETEGGFCESAVGRL